MIRAALFFTLLWLTFVVMGPSARAQSAQQIQQDAERLEALHEQAEALDYTLSDTISEQRGMAERIQGKLEDQRKWLELRREVARFWEAMKERYGNGTSENQAGQTIRREFADYIENPEDKFWALYRNVLRSEPDEVMRANLHHCIRQVEDMVDVEDRELRWRIGPLEAAEATLPICPQFHSSPPPVFQRRMERVREQLGPLLERTRAEQLELVRQRHWPRGARRVSGGGSTRALARAAQGHLAENEQWGGNTEREISIVAVQVSGDWVIAERSPTGRPTKYGLPVIAAVIQPSTPEGQVDVFELTMVTPNARKGRRFEGARVGDSQRMLLERVPGGRRAARRR